jgi:CRP-like cAMP-binding protein
MTDPHPLHLMLRKLETHSSLNEEDRRAVMSLPYTIRSFEPHAYTLREGEKPTACGVLLSGFAYRQKLTSDGSRQILALHIPGEPLNFQNLFLDEADHNVQMLTRGEMAIIPREELQELARSRSAISHAILVTILVEASIFREFGSRLEAQGLAEDYGYQLPMTQEQLADVLGLTPVHVNRTIKSLEADGLITRKGRNITFPDWERMQEVGDFNRRYLHLQKQVSGNRS